ncbi:MAG TPA: DUF1592 domain-containing protein [Polyangia bacterium]
MKVPAVVPPFNSGLRVLGWAFALSLTAACTGQISGSDPSGSGNGAPGASGGNTSGGGTGTGSGSGSSGSGTGTSGSGNGSGTSGGGTTNPVNADVGRIAIHRLNNTEYDNTIRDLLGVAAGARTSFIPDEKAHGFDNIAAAAGVTGAQYEQYFNAAHTLTEKVFADIAARGRLMTCTPTSATDTTCIKNIVRAFGKRAYRRPLDPAEVDSLAKLATEAMALGEDAAGGIKHVVRTVLASPSFLYRIELDPDPKSATPRKLNGYELASRLSYLHWSTMPDDQLFGLADSGELLKDDVLSAQIDRMLADNRAVEFTNNFAGQWLGMQKLQAHQVEGTVFPAWDEPLRASMLKEGLAYFNEFLSGARPMSEFFTADINFVDAKLGAFYGIPGGDAQTKKVTHTADQRIGFLGLGAYLTQTSFAYRTAPTLRGHWVLENLLCEHVPPPPAAVPELDKAGTPATMTQSQNVRERLKAHREDPQCAGCHALLDPIGLGLENFDAIGRYRTKYPNGDDVDASGVLPSGETFTGLPALAAILGRASDTRLIDCTVEKFMTYALSREMGASDKPALTKVRDTWKQQGLSLRALLKTVIMSDSFRQRRGEPQ